MALILISLASVSPQARQRKTSQQCSVSVPKPETLTTLKCRPPCTAQEAQTYIAYITELLMEEIKKEASERASVFSSSSANEERAQGA